MVKPVICAVCGKPIAPNDSRYLDVHAETGATRQVHIHCQKAAK
jgi:hypothetical protein